MPAGRPKKDWSHVSVKVVSVEDHLRNESDVLDAFLDTLERRTNFLDSKSLSKLPTGIEDIIFFSLSGYK